MDHSSTTKIPTESSWIDWFKRIHWVHTIILFGTPIIAVYGIATHRPHLYTIIFTFIYYMLTGLGITAGYHRLWSHRSYDASLPVRFLLLIFGTGALEGSLKWWCNGHRIHHRYTDTDFDPYNAKRGLFYSHIGWMLVHPHSEHKIKADVHDLLADPLINFQHRNYFWFGPFMAYIFPALIAGFFWADFWGGFYYCGALRLFLVHHSTFCVNSIAHYIGDDTYDDLRTPRDSILTAIVTFGEGYHNFHHEFPNDYRNGIKLFDYDPTKWLILFLSYFGLTYNLHKFPHNEISKGKVQMLQMKLDKQKAALRWPVPISELEVLSWAQIKQRIEKGQLLVVIQNIIHDVTSFISHHPGGKAILKGAVGTDATKAFTGKTGIYSHSRAAQNLLSNFRVARLSDTPVSEPKI